MPNLRTAYLVVCDECGRVFDLVDPEDRDEWSFGHDCEDNEEEQ